MYIEELLKHQIDIGSGDDFFVIDLDDIELYDYIINNIVGGSRKEYTDDNVTTIEMNIHIKSRAKILGQEIDINTSLDDIYIEDFGDEHRRLIIYKDNLLDTILEDIKASLSL